MQHVNTHLAKKALSAWSAMAFGDSNTEESLERDSILLMHFVATCLEQLGDKRRDEVLALSAGYLEASRSDFRPNED